MDADDVAAARLRPPELDNSDRADAATALGRGAVLDPTALFTLGGLGTEYVEAALDRLGDRALIAQATLDDLDAGRTALLPEKATMQRQELTFDPATGEPTIVEWDEDSVRRDHAVPTGCSRSLTA